MQKIFKKSEFLNLNEYKSLFGLIFRDLIHYKRDFGRWIGVIIQPILFWLLIGNGIQNIVEKPLVDNLTYNQIFFISNLSLSVVFLASFSAMSLIQDRKLGLLSAISQSHVSSFTLAIFPIFSMFIFSLIQTFIFAIIGHSLGFNIKSLNVTQLIIGSFLACSSIGSFSVLLAWTLTSQHLFHALISMIFLPLWILSGSFYPLEGTFYNYVSILNPIYYINSMFRNAFIGNFYFKASIVLTLFSIVSIALASQIISMKRSQL